MFRLIIAGLLCSACMLYNTAASAQCYNGDVEAGSFTNWTGYTSLNTNGAPRLQLSSVSGNPNDAVPGLVPGRHDLMNNPAAFDPVVGGSIMPTVFEGNHSIRLGSTVINQSAQTIAYTFTVTAANAKNTSFAYALVLQDPGTSHKLQEKPFFEWWISTTNQIQISRFHLPFLPKFGLIYSSPPIYADMTNPFFTSLPNGTVYKNWQTVCLPNLSSYIGRQVTIYFHTAGCTLGGHYGYAYIDGLCKPNNATPNFTGPNTGPCPQQLICDPTSSRNVTDYYWQIEQVNCNSGATVSGTSQTVYFYNQPPAVTDVMDLYRKHGGVFTTGCYRITLGVRSCNGTWVTKSVTISLDIPPLYAANVIRCCNASGGVNLAAQITTTLGPGSFSWYDESGTYLGSGSVTVGIPWPSGTPTYYDNLTIANTANGHYRVVYTDRNGCSSTVWVYVVNKPNNFSVGVWSDFCYSGCASGPSKLAAVIRSFYDFCGAGNVGEPYYSMATDPSFLTYSWSTGETTAGINVHPGVNVYTVTVSNGCVSKTATIDISIQKPYTGSFPNFCGGGCSPGAGDIVATTGMILGDPNNQFVALEYMKPKGAFPSYKAIQYKLDIYDRWGNQVCSKFGSAPCEGFHNFDISWNGVISPGLWNAGQFVNANSTYYWQLRLYNCVTSVLYKGDVIAIK